MENENNDTKPVKTVDEVINDIDYIIYPEEQESTTSGLYDYFHETFGDRSDWNEFEDTYKDELADALIVNQSGVVEDLLNYKQEMLNLRMKLEGVEGKYNIRKDQNILAATQKEAEVIAKSEYSGMSAMRAYDVYKTHNLKSESREDKKMYEKEGRTADEKKKQDALNEAQIQKLTAADASLEYVVRGAPLMCNCGTHSRHLDMMESHGFYINGYAVVFEEDYQPDINIMYFGHCSSYDHPMEKIELKMGTMVAADGSYLSEPDTSVVEDFKCVPEFTKPWENTHEATIIAESVSGGLDGVEGAVYKKALTTASYIVCEHGGLVVPLTSGQYEASLYQAPFAAYPFNDFGSDVFVKWCEENNIIPYKPGEAEYFTEVRKKIDGLQDEGDELQKSSSGWIDQMAKSYINPSGGGRSGYENPYTIQITKNKVKQKQLYEQVLEETYTKGLDTMSEEEADKCQALLQEYLASGLLTDTEKEDLKKKYGGLRTQYGVSTNAKDQYTYQDPELYDETLQSLQELLEQTYMQRVVTHGLLLDYYATEKRTEQAESIYRSFMNELTKYGPGYDGLNGEQRESAAQIKAAYYKIVNEKQGGSADLKEEMDKFAR